MRLIKQKGRQTLWTNKNTILEVTEVRLAKDQPRKRVAILYLVIWSPQKSPSQEYRISLLIPSKGQGNIKTCTSCSVTSGRKSLPACCHIGPTTTITHGHFRATTTVGLERQFAIPSTSIQQQVVRSSVILLGFHLQALRISNLLLRSTAESKPAQWNKLRNMQ